MTLNNENDIRLVISDMDGVAFVQKNFYRDLQVVYDFDQEGYAFYKQQLAGATYADSYQAWAEKFLTGKDADKYFEMTDKREYSKGYQRFLNFAQLNGARTILLTSGPDVLAQRAMDDFNVIKGLELIDGYYANSMEVIDNKFTGKALVPVDDKDKSSCIMDLIEENKGHILCIGDGEPDIQVAKHADIVIAYNSQCEELNDMADLVIPKGHLALSMMAFTRNKKELESTKAEIMKAFAHEFVLK